MFTISSALLRPVLRTFPHSKTMTKKKPTSFIKSKKQITIYQQPDETAEQAEVKALTNPATQAAMTIHAWQSSLDLDCIAEELKAQTKTVKEGDLQRAEAILLAQAHTLDKLFNRLAVKAHNCEYLNQFETNFKLALKAQNQCRMTLETLSTIKNPPVVYAKQANISSGPQQINNGIPSPSVYDTHAGKNQNQPNELLEVQHGSQTLDQGTTHATSRQDQAMATLE